MKGRAHTADVKAIVDSMIESGVRPKQIKTEIPDVSGAFIAKRRKLLGIPPFKSRIPGERTLQIEQMLRDGCTPREIRGKFPKVNSATVWQLTQKLGLPRWQSGTPIGSSALQADRLQIIRRGLSTGKTQASIAREMGLTSSDIHIILYPERNRARKAVYRAVRRGQIIKQNSCESCSAESAKLEAHHEDYSKQLEVTWLCIPCHRKLA